VTTIEEPSASSRLPCRLFAILAHEAPRAVILRRGPSKWVQAILWHTDDDTFEYGQWFHGHIYERRCDLSPDGVLFIYFASKITGRTLRDPEYTYAWTAISKPPYLTALALWPKGDTWDGGGLFRGRRTVVLNHDPAHMASHPAHRPRGLKVLPWPGAEGDWPRGENGPVYGERLKRDGWRLAKKGAWPPFPISSRRRRWEAEQPTVWQKVHPSGRYRLRWTLRAYDFGRLGGTEVSDFAIEADEPGTRVPLVGATWAEWDQRGRLVFAREGQLYATSATEPRDEAIMRADFNDQRPYDLPAPDWARTW